MPKAQAAGISNRLTQRPISRSRRQRRPTERVASVSYTNLDVYKRQQFKSVGAVKDATPDQLENTPGVGRQLAQTIYE